MQAQFLSCIIWLSFVFRRSDAQLPGPTPDQHPRLQLQDCDKDGCRKIPASITVDAGMRSLKSPDGRECFSNNTWDATLCSDPVKCAKSCALGAFDYAAAGVASNGRSLSIKLFNNPANNTGARVYMLDGKDKYQMFYLLNREFSFEVDVSKQACGTNGALYFSSMKPDGGNSDPAGAGAAWGNGYCDAQAPKYLRFVEGKANINGSSTGQLGYACPELDIFEANSISQAFTPHPCKSPSATICEAEKCQADGGLCDSPGCDFASYRMGDTNFYGPSKRVNTKEKFQVVTQFITADNTDTGELVEIRRLYVQNGQVFNNSKVDIPKIKAYDSITQQFCDDITKTIGGGGTSAFNKNGGLKSMGEAMKKGMVLTISNWVDEGKDRMLWLDGTFTGSDSSKTTPGSPGTVRGTCDAASSDPAVIRKNHPDATVEFGMIKTGRIGTTFGVRKSR